MELVSQMFGFRDPGEGLTIEHDGGWIVHPLVASEQHPLGLGLGWDRVSGEGQVVLHPELLADGDHLLQHMPVGGQ